MTLLTDTYDDFRRPPKTWEKFGIVDWKNKSVMDVGCHKGWMLNQALLAGARRAVGVDLNGFHTNVFRKEYEKPFDFIRRTYPKIELIEGDWLTVNVPVVDIILCCNTIHYFSDINKGIEKIFSHAKEWVVLETVQQVTVDWDLVDTCRSHWNSRIIKIFKNNRKKGQS